MPKKLSKEELECRELRSHSTIRKAKEVVESYGKRSTKSEVQYLGSLYRKTLESLCPELFGGAKDSGAKEPLEEPSSCLTQFVFRVLTGCFFGLGDTFAGAWVDGVWVCVGWAQVFGWLGRGCLGP